ncbi:MAG: translation initiation factor IF-2 N-terminal domain-containing protein, partial [Gordonia sp. (in: high G+C Gram-positive bacteria)]|uniref:translation initiation factor IF-2 N-terminal domain-containing protein n=1 Tax=Gordonia sp. (in: high G+C Gram-positive bacteria) TaxID=84139 RepID=UPI003BB72299
MAGKARVHELAKEFGVTSKELLERLKEQGEFVKSASSTVEAPVARRLREAFKSAGGGADSAPASAATKAAPKKPEAPAAPAPVAAKPTAAKSAAPKPGVVKPGPAAPAA